MDKNSDAAELGLELERLASRDPFVRWLGIVVERATAGEVRVSMTVRAEHMNFNGTCHGGVLFSLADTAFGLASNSRGVMAMGIHADVAYCSAASVGDVLTAQAKEVSRSKRVGTYSVRVEQQDGRAVAIFTGTVHCTERPHAC
jgi:acyl-CoA thioesterase